MGPPLCAPNDRKCVPHTTLQSVAESFDTRRERPRCCSLDSKSMSAWHESGVQPLGAMLKKSVPLPERSTWVPTSASISSSRANGPAGHSTARACSSFRLDSWRVTR
eukprot:scaffold142287_cov148-Phaeocystis_antarctica.AAC.1